MVIKLKSVYDAPTPEDGRRYLVETLWPQERFTMDLSPCEWVHELSPSYRLRQRQNEERWSDERFREEYWKELERKEAGPWVEKILNEAERGVVTLVYSVPDPSRSSARLLKEFLEPGTVRPLDF